MAEQFYTIPTAIGKAKIANSIALGAKVNLKTMKIGDSNGIYYNPSESQTDLVHTVYSCEINSVEIDESNSNWINVVCAIPADVGDFFIREVGIFDDNNDLIAIGKYPETYKPLASNGSTKELYIKMTFEVTNVSSVTLKIDPTVILATKNDINILTNSISSINAQLSDTVQQISNISYNIVNFPLVSGEINDTNRIIRALTKISSNGGGKILFPNGTYISAPFRIPKNIKIIGESLFGTILKLADNSSGDFISFIASQGAGLCNLTLNGNKENQNGLNCGIYLEKQIEPYTSDSNHLIEIHDILVTNFSSHGMYDAGGSWVYSIRNMESSQNAGWGIYENGGTDHEYVNVNCFRNDLGGIRLNGSNIKIFGGKLYHNGVFNRTKGQLTVENASAIQAFGVDIQDTFGHGLYLDHVVGSSFSVIADTAGWSYKADASNPNKWQVGYIDAACIYINEGCYEIDLSSSIVKNYTSGDGQNFTTKWGVFIKQAIGRINIDNIIYGGGIEIKLVTPFMTAKKRESALNVYYEFLDIAQNSLGIIGYLDNVLKVQNANIDLAIVTKTLKMYTDMLPGATGTRNVGNPTYRFNGVYANLVCSGSGATASRPAASVGVMWFDTTLNKPIWYSGTHWVDATGTTV